MVLVLLLVGSLSCFCLNCSVEPSYFLCISLVSDLRSTEHIVCNLTCTFDSLLTGRPWYHSGSNDKGIADASV
jgi:hypothetical protein